MLSTDRQEEDEAETEFVRVIDHFAMNHQPVALLSKSIMTNVLTISTLVIWSIVLVTSILPVTTTTNAGKRDLVETVLEIGEKCLGFAAATSKSYLWRVITFALFAGYAILKKGLEVHMDTAPERVACSRWSFVGALAAKALEHLAYAVRLTPASRAWNFCDNTKAWGARGLSVEQVARRRIWAVGYYKSELLAAHARNRRWRTMQ